MDGMRTILCQWNKNEPLLQVWKGSWSGHTVHIKKLVAKDDVFSSQTVQETFPREYPKLRYAKRLLGGMCGMCGACLTDVMIMYIIRVLCVFMCVERDKFVFMRRIKYFSLLSMYNDIFNKTKCEVHYTGSELKLIVILIRQFTLS